MDKKYIEISGLLKVLSHPVRLCIIKGLIENGGCNVSHMQSCLDIPQSTVSQHLQKLKSAGLIEGTRKGLEVEYKISDPRVIEIIKTLFK